MDALAHTANNVLSSYHYTCYHRRGLRLMMRLFGLYMEYTLKANGLHVLGLIKKLAIERMRGG